MVPNNLLHKKRQITASRNRWHHQDSVGVRLRPYPPLTLACQAVTVRYYTKEIMYSQEWISPYMCAAFWSDILVIISLGRYLYMLLCVRGRGPWRVDATRPAAAPMICIDSTSR